VKSAALVVGCTLALTADIASAQLERARLASAVDSIAAAALSGGKAAGMSIAVVRARDTVVLRAYGKADLELDVATPDRAVYEIGSVTKQFTAASILQLVEQGKLSLDDEITKYSPRIPCTDTT
jgi:D-alanyl-D-alanine carboxypeptidase